jgi:pyruvate/2-oxoglutarate dehydrogenase complex dihydrolipoamide acyltransferase (E2) component
MQNKLFRSVALERLSTPERLDELMEVTTPRGWLGMAALWATLGAAVAWGFLGSIPTIVSGQGILIRDGSVVTVESPAAGQVMDLFVNVGDPIREEQVVARVVQQGDASRDGGTSGRTIYVTSPYAGRVQELRLSRGGVIQAGAALLSVEVSGRALEAILYLSPLDGKKVHPGMTVQLSPAPVKQEEWGRMLGRVVSVGDFPATAPAMKRVLGSDELVKTMSSQGAPIEIHVELARSATTSSGYAWTSTASSALTLGVPSLVGSGVSTVRAAGWLPDALADWAAAPGSELRASPGPPIRLQSGTFCAADVVVDDQAPITLVFAKLNR